jgi:hypothetical protein
LGFAIKLYTNATPSLEVGDNATTILGEDSEPQPDLTLRRLPEYGGHSHVNAEGYVEGPPELLAEIAYSSVSLDLHAKRDDYKQAGVLEYLVVCLEEPELRWFHFPSASTIKPGKDGIGRSKAFPGLWLDGSALLARNTARVVEVVQQGLASKEHAAFVKKLEKAHRPPKPQSEP